MNGKLALTAIAVVVAVLASGLVAVSPDSDGVSATPSSVEAYDGSTYTYTTYTQPAYNSHIDGFEENEQETHVRVQSRMEGYEVWKISSDAFDGNPHITSVLFPEPVREFGDSVFTGCSAITEIIFMGQKPTFTESTFEGLPSNVVFRYTQEYAESWEGFTDFDKEVIDVKTYTGDSCSFTYYQYDGSITVKEWVSGLEIVIPDTIDGLDVTDIDTYAFSWTEYGEDKPKITSVTLGANVETIHIAAFKYAQYIKTVSLPDSLTSICDEAFRMPIDTKNWQMGSIEELTLPSGLKYIGFEAFRMSYALKSVTIPESVTHFGEGAFRVCSSMKSFTFNNEMTSISNSAFDECHMLETINIPAGVESIGDSAFLDCYQLNNVVIPDGCTEIKGGAFNNCSSLVDIALPDNCTIGSSAFYYVPLQKVTVTLGTDDPYTNGILETYFSQSPQSNAGPVWKFPGMKSSDSVSLLTVDTSKAIAVGTVMTDQAHALRLSAASVNTVGGTFCNASGTEIVGADRAGKTYIMSDGKQTETKVAMVTLDVSPALHMPVSGSHVAGKVTGAGIYAIGDKATIEATPVQGYYFQKWDDGVAENRRTFTVTGDTSLVAVFGTDPVTTYKVTFDLKGHGSLPETEITVVSGDLIEKPADPVQEGYKFGGWYKDTSCTVVWDFSKDTVTQNTVLYAKWTQVVPSSGGDNTTVIVVIAVVAIAALAGAAAYLVRKRNA